MRLEYFQMIDRIVDADRGARRLRAACTIPTESTIFEGHFPGYPLMPGVLLAETMAQTSGWLVVALNKFDRMPFLAALKDAKFRTFVVPGMVLEVEAKLEHDGSGYAITNCSITSSGKSICDATITLRVMPFPNDEIRQHMREQAVRLGVPSVESAHG